MYKLAAVVWLESKWATEVLINSKHVHGSPIKQGKEEKNGYYALRHSMQPPAHRRIQFERELIKLSTSISYVLAININTI